MNIKQLELTNYTNYEQEKVEFSPNINILIGENAQGKSNLIDSIFFMGTGRSHRHFKELLLVKWGETFFRLKGEIINKRGNFLIEHAVKKDKKLVKINGVSIDSLKKLVGFFGTIVFTPDDLNLVKGSPDFRRRFLNRKLVQINPLFYEHSLSYQKTLLQRNNLLKRGNISKEEIEIWNEQLSDFGSKIIFDRIKNLSKLEPICKEIHDQLSGKKEAIELKYQPSFMISEEAGIEKIKTVFINKLAENYQVDYKKGFTSIGPHRDDFSCYLNNIDARLYGSQGQQRTTVLTLKLAMLKLLRQETGEFPVLLLDDVFSELDQERREFLLDTINNSVQTIITTTDLTAFNKDKIRGAKITQISAGRVIGG